MYFAEKIDNIIFRINTFNKERANTINLINEICQLFDLALLEDNLNDNEISILYFFSNYIGIPQYFDLLCKLKKIKNEINVFNQLMLSTIVKESDLYIDKEIKLHIFQKDLLEKFRCNDINRFFVSAATSFGKTFVVYSIIKKMKYENIALIFPTVSLLSENLERFMKLNNYESFKHYKIITLSEEKLDQKNILIFTPERFMTFIDKNTNIKLDFIFIDEIYKIDSLFTCENISDDEDEKVSDDRDIAFRIALEMAIKRTKDILLAGPFLNIKNSQSINNFINDNNFNIIDYNDYDLVCRERFSYKELKHQDFNGIRFDNIFCKNNNTEKIYSIINKLSDEQSIIYCSTKYLTEDYALKIAQKKIYHINKNDRFVKLITHLKEEYSKDWCLVKCLEEGIGIHHGTIPKYIQKEIIRMFNDGTIKCIFSTTTITEGVNTTAKNMIILSHKKGNCDLKKFDILNIIGRAGRFNQHFSGRVFIIDNDITTILDSNQDILTHKNYLQESKKTDIDLSITKDEYLNNNDLINKEKITLNYDKNCIPEIIRNSFLMITPSEKIKLFNLIKKIIHKDDKIIDEIIKKINGKRLSLDLIEKMVRMIRHCIPPKDLLYEYTENTKSSYSYLTYILNGYLIGGYNNLLSYCLGKGESIDRAVRYTSKIVYNILRFQLVKHISIIDLIYRTILSIEKKINIDDVQGFSSLLSYLEYGAYTETGRKISDFGVPFRVIKYVEDKKTNLDDYEYLVYEEAKKIII